MTPEDVEGIAVLGAVFEAEHPLAYVSREATGGFALMSKPRDAETRTTSRPGR